MFPQSDYYIDQSDDNDAGHPPADFQTFNGGSESGDTEEDRVSPPIPPVNSDALDVSPQLAPDSPELRSVIQELLQGDLTQEIPDDKCAEFNVTPASPKYTCGLFGENGQPCTKSFGRLDRFRHHLQTHLGLKPYSCKASTMVTAEPKCDSMFSSIAARDTHVRNKVSVMRRCGTGILPKNFARHRMICSKCSTPLPGATTRRSNL